MPRLMDFVVRTAYRTVYWAARGWWFLRRPRTSSALVALWRGDRVLLVQSSYRPDHSLPGGFLRRSESPAVGAARELREELGISLRPDLLREAWRGTRRFEHREDTITIFEVATHSEVGLRFDRREIVWAGWLTADEALGQSLLPHVRAYLDTRR